MIGGTPLLRLAFSTAFLLAALTGPGSAQELQATMNKISAEGIGAPIGTVTITSTGTGTQFTPDLIGLPPGEHGFHVHANGNCGPGPNQQGTVTAGMAAGGHWDPASTGAHRGPEGEGHLGDVPVMVVAPDGTATGAVEAPRIDDLGQLSGKALMIHAGGDNYSDEPEPLGGGGGRIACGVIE
jgi:Cu-Zn family superoxide dismutase